MDVVLIRHTSVGVPKGTCYGWSDVPVADTFEAEAAETKRNLGDTGFDAVFSSPLTSVPERDAVHDNKKYFNDFYDGGYRRFVVSSEMLTKLKKDASKRKSMTVDVTVNVRALREDLEKNGVIRKFGL